MNKFAWVSWANEGDQCGGVEVKQTGKELTSQDWANQQRTKQVWRENQAGEEHKETGGKTEYWKRA